MVEVSPQKKTHPKIWAVFVGKPYGFVGETHHFRNWIIHPKTWIKDILGGIPLLNHNTWMEVQQKYFHIHVWYIDLCVAWFFNGKLPSLKLRFSPLKLGPGPQFQERIIFQPSIFRGENLSFRYGEIDIIWTSLWRLGNPAISPGMDSKKKPGNHLDKLPSSTGATAGVLNHQQYWCSDGPSVRLQNSLFWVIL